MKWLLVLPAGLALLAACPAKKTGDTPSPPAKKDAAAPIADAVVALPPAPPVPEVPAGLPSPPAAPVAITPEAVALGELLFWDTRLSSTNAVACATCHVPEQGFAGEGQPPTAAGKPNLRRAPALVNLAWQKAYGWDGRYASLAEQLAAHVRGQLGDDLAAAVTRISDVPGYRARFARMGDAPAADAAMTALSAYVLTRYAGNAPFDRVERAPDVPAELKAGYAVFTGKAQCSVCHTPPLYTDHAYHRLGLIKTADEGRGRVDATKQGAFKTPTLRGAALRRAFFHDASASALEQAIDWHLAGGTGQGADPSIVDLKKIALTPAERTQLLAFVRSLTDALAPQPEAGAAVMADSWRTRARNELEVILGGVQMRAMERAIARVAGVRAVVERGVAHYVRPGKRGFPFVGIHGFGGDKETWLMMSALLPRARGVALIDLPGHGRSAEVPESEASIRHHAEAVLRVLDRHHFERAVICGNSMGGGVALRLAASWPDRVAGLVLVASIGRDVHDGGALQWLEGENPLIPREEDVERFMQLVLERPPPVGRAVIRYAITMRARRADLLHRLFRGFILHAGDAGVPRGFGGIQHRALVIHGEQDRIIDKRVAEDLTLALPRAELVIMRGVGHAPQLEAPRHTARIVERFIRTLERQ